MYRKDENAQRSTERAFSRMYLCSGIIMLRLLNGSLIILVENDPSLLLPKAALKETGSFLVLLEELIAKQGSSNDNDNDNNSNRVSKTSKTSCRVISHCYPIFSLS